MAANRASRGLVYRESWVKADDLVIVIVDDGWEDKGNEAGKKKTASGEAVNQVIGFRKGSVDQYSSSLKRKSSWEG